MLADKQQGFVYNKAPTADAAPEDTITHSLQLGNCWMLLRDALDGIYSWYQERLPLNRQGSLSSSRFVCVMHTLFISVRGVQCMPCVLHVCAAPLNM